MRLPTMVLYANGDEIVPSKPISDAEATMPGTKTVVCYGDGFHMLLRDLKGERTWNAVEAFVDGRDAETGTCAQQ